ncbi:choice-of-anchor I family protein [Reyranella sp.]|uniref:choice-of-anchor I family protein n=1 Tax=Reyranella sp. TaxID=1929291 RepID=UPI004036307A
MSTSYHSLASGTFTQDWSNIDQITTSDDWSDVPSIMGYRGDDLTSATGTDPRTLTADGTPVIDVNANETNPTTFTTGGVTEFHLDNPTIALAGSGTADAPSLVFYLDATGRQDIRVQFYARDVETSTDNAAQPLNVQYRIGSTGAWTNVTDGYFDDVTMSGTTVVENRVDVTLPADANNQPQVQVRVMTTNAAGADEWVGIDDINISSTAASAPIDLSTYVLVARYDLPEPTRTTAPANSVLAQEVSGVTYNWDTDTLFVVGDGGTSVVQVSKTGQLIDSMTLAQGGSPQGTTFYDPEGITYIGNGKFVMTEERDRQAVEFTYAAGTVLDRSGAKTVDLGTFVQNIGLEGLTYDPSTGGFIFVKESGPEGIFQTGIDFDAGTATNGSSSTENSVDLFDPTLAGLADFADVFALSNLPALNGSAEAGHLLVLSQEDGRIVQIDRAGQVHSSLTIVSNPGNPLSVPAQQHEGLTMDRDGNLYVVSENGGGDFDHPQLWVYAPSSAPNQAPTAVALDNQTNTLPENTNTATRIKVADVAITDDGLGTNQLTVTGADADFFEVDSNGLYIKAGTTLDFETKSIYSVAVNVDDASVGDSPEATATFTLSLSNIEDEAPAAPALYVSEVAPWSSGNSPAALGVDWFEITNGGTSAIDITDWKIDDSSASFANAVLLNGITTINPGESVIFLEAASGDFAAKKAAFLETWFGANPPANLQIGSYGGSGVGLSTGGDAVNLYNAAGVLQTGITFGTSPAGPFPTFDNSAGLNNTTVSQLSATGVHSAFAAAGDVAEIGSPGTVGKVFVSEVAPWSSAVASIGADWFEVTNSSAFAADITGWKMDDNSGSPTAAVALSGITTIQSGESVIFLEVANAGEFASKKAAFLSTWFGTTPPADLQIGSYSGSGVGLSTGGDAVNLYNAAGVLQATVAFGASPAGTPLATFDNVVGASGAPTPISQLSVTGVNGALAAAEDASEIGSPGQIASSSPIDTTAPTLASATPGDNAAGVASSADIVLNFSEAVKAGTGDITVTNGAGDVRTITIGINDSDGMVTVNGNQVRIDLATGLADGSHYDVIVAAGAIEDTAGNDFAGIAAGGLGFTTAGPALTAIYTIQGAGHRSTLAGTTVTTQGVVTAIDSNGFYIQDATGDGNAATSDAVFVFTGSAPTVTKGHLVQVMGTVSEFIPNGAAAGSLSLTQLTAPTVTDMGEGPAIAAVQIGGSAGLKPPTSNLDDDGLTSFDPVNDGIDFFEALEGMLVTVKAPVAVSPTNGFGEIFTIVDNDDNLANGLNTNSPSAHGGVIVAGGTSSFGNTNTVGGDFNPERIQIDDDSGILAGFVTPSVNVGAQLGDVTGVVSYAFGQYEVVATEAYAVTSRGTLAPEATSLVGTGSRLTVANYNIENLDPADGAAKFNALAQQIFGNLKAPDILCLQEAQDNNGPTNDSVTSASTTLQMLVDAINTLSAASGGTARYAFQDNLFIGDDLNGGEPGGNIRVAYLYRVDRGVDLIESSLRTIDANGAATTVVGGNAAAGHPFFASRPPLVADFTFNGQTMTIVNNHFSSKSGSGALMGTQPPFDAAEDTRAAQAQAVNIFVDSLLAADPDARVVVAGDLNEFEFEEPMAVLQGTATYRDGADADALPEYTTGGIAVLDSLSEMLPVDQRYDYVFDGNSQSLDQMYVTDAARAGAQYDIVHMNAEFASQASDHDALVASFDMSARVSTAPTGEISFEVASSLTLAGAEISAFDAASDRMFTTSSVGLQVVDLANPAAPALIATINFTTLGFSTTDITSVAVRNGIVAVALPAADKTQPGQVVFLKASDHTLLGSVQVGALPDMLVFTPDGRTVLVANEGEPDASGADAAGSVSIIDLSAGVSAATVRTATFDSFNGQEDALRAEGVRIFAGKSVSMDVEPEYIAISPDGTKAMVTLQEANALAILDIATGTFTDIVPLGLKDWTGLKLDVSDRDGPNGTTAINLITDSHLFGMYMPDAISGYQVGGQTFYVMANEGDDRDDFLAPDETIRVSSGSYDLDNALYPDEAALKSQAELGRHTVSNGPGLRGDTDGDGDIDQMLTYGGRSFSIVDSAGTRVFDSADVIERIIAEHYPALFDDTRSDNKGPEPEGIVIGTVGGHTYVFVGLERSNITLAFDITDPANVTYTGAAYNAGDLSPEGLLFIPAADSPTGKDLLVSSNEVSNTVTIFEVNPPPPFTLQLLHLSDAEAGLLAGDTAPNLAALVDAFDGQYANTLILSGGDNFLPGPFLNAGTDPSLSAVAGIGTTGAGRPDTAILNAIGVETSTIGNHEFDLGSTAFRDAFSPSGAWGGANFPYLSSNLDFSGDAVLAPRYTNTLDGGTGTSIAEAGTLKGRIAPAAVVTEGGQKIGIVGVTTQVLESISSPNGTEVKGFPGGAGPNGEVDDLTLLAAQLQPIIDEMIAEGINKIIVTSHLQQIANEQLLATKLKGVDIILSAGSHTRLGDADDEAVAFPGHEASFDDTYPIVTQGLDGKTTVIVNTDGEYTYLGRLVVDFDANGDIIMGSLTENVSVNGAYAATTETVAEAWGVDEAELETTAFADGTKGDQVRDITEAVDAVIASKDGTVFGFTDVYLEGERAFIRSQETNLGNLSADSGIYAAKKALGDAADDMFIVGLRNGGGIRAQIGSVDQEGDKVAPIANSDAGKPAGGVSQLDVENALRFDNKTMVFDTDAAGLKTILEHSVAAGANQGRFAQIGGLRYSYDPDNAAGSKVMNIALVDQNGVVIRHVLENGVVSDDAPGVITVSTTSFTANGGDGYPIKANGSNFRFLLNNGVLGLPVDEALDFTLTANTPTDALGEQDAFEAYMQARHGTSDRAYDTADTPEALDIRIENLNSRADGVFAASGSGGDGNDHVTGTEAIDDLMAGAGHDTVSGGAGADLIDLGSGADVMRDSLSNLNGDRISGFGLSDMLDIDGALVGRSNLIVTKTVDGVTLGAGGSTFHLVGDFAAGDFLAVTRGVGVDAHTSITFERYLPTLSEGVGVNPALINGIASEEFLTGDGNVEFTLSMRSATSEYKNSLGSYMVAADGTISDVRILFSNTLGAGSATVNLGKPDANEKIGFFLVQDGYDAYGNLPSDLSFVNPGTLTVADLDNGLPPALRSATLGQLNGAHIFHSFSTLNPGDANQALSGISTNGRELLIGFEDQAVTSGDNDFQDVVFSIRVNSDGLLVV